MTANLTRRRVLQSLGTVSVLSGSRVSTVASAQIDQDQWGVNWGVTSSQFSGNEGNGLEFERPVVTDDSVYTHQNNDETRDTGQVRAFDIQTGEQRWKLEGGYITHITHNDGVVYIGFEDQFRGVDASSGDIVWRFDKVPKSKIAIQDNDILYKTSFGADDYYILVDKNNETEKWRVRVRDSTHDDQPIITANTIYFGSSNKLFAVDRDDGSEIWNIDFNENYDLGDIDDLSPMTSKSANGVLYAWLTGIDYPDNVPTVLAVDASTGTIRWRVNKGRRADLFGEPAVDDEKVYVTIIDPNNILMALDKDTGDTIWSRTANRPAENYPMPEAQPALFNDDLYVSSNDGFLYSLNPQTGDVQWRRFVGFDVYPPVVKNDTITTVGHQFGAGTSQNPSFLLSLKKGGAEFPTASLSYSPDPPGLNREMILDASESETPNESIIDSFWSIFYNNDQNTRHFKGKRTRYRPETTGRAFIELIVIDNVGGIARDTASVEIQQSVPTPTPSPTPIPVETQSAEETTTTPSPIDGPNPSGGGGGFFDNFQNDSTGLLTILGGGVVAGTGLGLYKWFNGTETSDSQEE